MRYCFAIAARSHGNQCVIALKLLRNLRNRYAINTQSLRNQYAIGLESLCNRSEDVAQSLRNRLGIGYQSLRNCCTITA
jgi:hypothetical protein